MSTSRHGTKYRPSLSCSICRRRKVRCGKEKPACGNCVRMNEICEYDRAPGMGDRKNEGSSGVGMPSPLTSSVDENLAVTSSVVDVTSTIPQKRTHSPGERAYSQAPRDLHQVSHSLTEPKLFPRTPDIQGLFSYQDKFRPRLVETSFWGYVPGHEPNCEELLSQEHRYPNVRAPILDVAGLFESLKTMASPTIREALLSSFMIGAQPLHCLIHEPSLRAAYDASTVAFNRATVIPRGCIFADPTLICLVHAVLYCGALIAQPSTWLSPALKDLHKETTIKHLSRVFFASLEQSKYTKIPTLNTLTALLLVRSCAKIPSEPPLEDIFFVSMVVLMARSMGLHREDALSEMEPVQRELGRRTWWHIRWLDVQVSVLNGSKTSCGCSESPTDTKAVQATATDEYMNCEPDASIGVSQWVEGSISRIFTAGRFEAARFQRSLLHIISELDQMDNSGIANIIDALNKLRFKMDSLISQIPAEGIPERGMIPSRLANASPSTHQRLYVDNANEPTVFGAWARIVLSIFKAENSLILYKLLLGRTDFSDEVATWDIIIDICLSNLRNFTQLVQTPAFQPYLWFSQSRCAPLQATNLSIIYLEHKFEPEKRQLVRYFVDEVIDFYAPSTTKASDFASRPVDTTPAAWNMLKTLRDKLDEPLTPRQSLDDLATEALASSSTPGTIKDDMTSPQRQAIPNYSEHAILLQENMGEHEPCEQEIAEKFAASLTTDQSQHGTCSEGFEKVSQEFFRGIHEQ